MAESENGAAPFLRKSPARPGPADRTPVVAVFVALNAVAFLIVAIVQQREWSFFLFPVTFAALAVAWWVRYRRFKRRTPGLK